MRPDTECKSFGRSLNDVRGRDHTKRPGMQCTTTQNGKPYGIPTILCGGCRFIFNNSSSSNQSRAFDELVRFSGDSASAATTNDASYYPVVASRFELV